MIYLANSKLFWRFDSDVSCKHSTIYLCLRFNMCKLCFVYVLFQSFNLLSK